MLDDAAVSWTSWGQRDPYHAILSCDDRFRSAGLTEAALEAFFASGEEHVAAVLRRVEAELGTAVPRGRAVDFGCGAGRLLLPLACTFREAVGVDISPPMRRLAEEHARRRGLANVRVVADPATLRERFDFVHSVLVFQHVPPRRGLIAMATLLDHLSDDGVAALHVPFADGRAAVRRLLARMRVIGPVNWSANLLRRRAWDEPLMRMYIYDLNHCLALAQRHGIGRVALWAHDHNEFPYVYLLMSRRP